MVATARPVKPTVRVHASIHFVVFARARRIAALIKVRTFGSRRFSDDWMLSLSRIHKPSLNIAYGTNPPYDNDFRSSDIRSVVSWVYVYCISNTVQVFVYVMSPRDPPNIQRLNPKLLVNVPPQLLAKSWYCSQLVNNAFWQL